MKDLLKKLVDQENTEYCKGKIYKAKVSQYPTKRGVGLKIYLEERSRLSCPGCDKCGWLPNALDDYISEGCELMGLESAENGQLYTIQMCNISTDWESGHVDNWDLEIVPCEEDLND